MNDITLNEDIAMVYQPELLGAIDKILVKDSIARRVSDEQKLTGPLGIITGASWDKITDKMTLATADVSAITRKIRTQFTLESLQDLKNTYKESFYDLLARYIVDELAYRIDADFITMISTRAPLVDSLVFDAANYNNALWAVAQSISIRVNKGLADLPISDNRSQLGWAVVSSNVASLLAGTLNDNGDSGTGEVSPSYLGRIGGVDYYIDYTNPNTGVDSVIFGIKGNGFSKGSTIYSPYKQEWIDTIDPSTGESVLFLLDRTGMSINPLDNAYYNNGAGLSGFLGKFNVDVSTLQVFN